MYPTIPHIACPYCFRHGADPCRIFCKNHGVRPYPPVAYCYGGPFDHVRHQFPNGTDLPSTFYLSYDDGVRHYYRYRTGNKYEYTHSCR